MTNPISNVVGTLNGNVSQNGNGFTIPTNNGTSWFNSSDVAVVLPSLNGDTSVLTLYSSGGAGFQFEGTESDVNSALETITSLVSNATPVTA